MSTHKDGAPVSAERLSLPVLGLRTLGAHQ
jgi:hypothetical protein